MTPMERGSLYLSALAMAVTGLGFGWFKYFHQRLGEFGTEPYASQGLLRHAHILIGPVLVFTLGLVIRGHVQPTLKSGTRKRRGSGLLVVAILAPMVLSGYGVQVCVDPLWRNALAWLHGLSSLAFLLGFSIHRV